MKIKFSTFTLSQVPELERTVEILNEQFEQFILAEQLGFSTVWIAEHLFSNQGVMGSCQVLAGAIARATKTIRIGTAVSIVPFNHPLRTASDFAAIDCMSNGRLNYGTGRAYQPSEFASLGLDMKKSREMHREGLEIILKAWEGRPFTYDGQFWKISDPTVVHPPIVQKPHPPIYTGAQSRDSFVEAGRRRSHIMMSAITACRADRMAWADNLAANLQAYDEACREAGHDPAKMERVLQIACHVSERSEDAERLYGPCVEWALIGNAAVMGGAALQDKFRFKDLKAAGAVALGTPKECAAQLRDLKKRLGLTEIMLEFNKGGLAHAHAVNSMRLFMEEVAPRVNEEGYTGKERSPAMTAK